MELTILLFWNFLKQKSFDDNYDDKVSTFTQPR